MAEGGSIVSTVEHWWGYYFLRYFVGTVVGAAVVLGAAFLRWGTSAVSICPLVLRGDAWQYLPALVMSGLAYCYVASAPMLTLHVVRIEILGPSDTKSRKQSELNADRKLWPLFSALVSCMVASLLGLWYGCASTGGARTFKLGFLIAPFALVVLSQIACIFRAHKNGFRLIIDFYKKLSAARASGTNLRKNSEVAEYLESYRHMREHSNAYGIIILELLLAPVLFLGCGTLNWTWQFIPIVLLWLLPPAYCWFIATLLELEFTNK